MISGKNKTPHNPKKRIAKTKAITPPAKLRTTFFIGTTFCLQFGQYNSPSDIY
jgi:hypothetical protein